MRAEELRSKYLDFFRSRGHAIIPSASLVPVNDPSTLFTTAGMHPLVPYLLGEKHPGGVRLTDVQKCIRTGDIDEVGDTTHHTFFEMLGNWSLGDYFKKEAIEMSWEFLTSPEYLNLDKNRLAVSVFQGDNDAPFDEEAFETWKNIFEKNGLPIARIAKLPKKNNWWGMEKGPCGPDSEMFYWVGEASEVPKSFNDDNSQWVEIWNDVFMEFNKTGEGKLEPLVQKNIDTGMGLERTLAALNGLDDNYRTELFWPIIEKIEDFSGKKYDENQKSFRIIADHLKASAFIIADGVFPSNTGSGYVLRRLIRRAIRHAKQINIENNFTKSIAEIVIEIYKNFYQELTKNQEKIFLELEKEEEKFRKTLDNGYKILTKEVSRLCMGELFEPDGSLLTDHIPITRMMKLKEKFSGKVAFDLYQNYGYPIEITIETLKTVNPQIEVDLDGFNKLFKGHQELSRTASAGMFKGGLADMSEATTKLHTAAHLMLATLRKVLGDGVFQKGSNITPERLRFDFSYPEKMTSEQIKKVEELVNEAIQKNYPVEFEEMDLEKAKNSGAMGVFDSKYGEKVKVYTIGSSTEVFSREICGGPHVKNTGVLGHFKIVKEESSSAGVRRIKAILE